MRAIATGLSKTNYAKTFGVPHQFENRSRVPVDQAVGIDKQRLFKWRVTVKTQFLRNTIAVFGTVIDQNIKRGQKCLISPTNAIYNRSNLQICIVASDGLRQRYGHPAIACLTESKR